jgi:hypothetical protein
MARPAATVALLCLLLPLCLPIPVFAQATELQSPQAVVHGTGSLAASLAGAVLENATQPGVLSLEVTKGLLVLKDETQDVAVPILGSAAPATHSASNSTLANATADDFRLVPGARLLLLPGNASLTSLDIAGMSLEASTAGTLEFPPRASITDPLWRIATGGTLDSARHESGDDVVKGSFQFVVWGASFRLHNQTGNHTVQTGSFDERIGPPGSPAVKRVQREAVFQVESGTLTFDSAMPFRVFLAACRVELAGGSLDVKDPIGSNPVNGEPILPGKHLLQLAAPLVADISGSGGNVTLAFPVPPRESNLDGTRISAPNSPPWLLALPLFALVAVPAGAVAYSQARLRRRLRALDRLVTTRRFEKALALARRIRRLRPRQPDALVAESLSLIHAKEYRRASGVLEAEGWTSALGPLRDYLRAAAASGAGRRADAVAALRRCLQDAPEMEREAALDPLLADLVPLASRRGGGDALRGAP